MLGVTCLGHEFNNLKVINDEIFCSMQILIKVQRCLTVINNKDFYYLDGIECNAFCRMNMVM
jgi:hypothetical protein